MRKLDLAGQRFKMLTVVEQVANKGARSAWLCRCDCGVLKSFTTGDLRGGRLVSCGCNKRDKTVMRNKISAIHGMTGSPTYITWFDMRRRCQYSKDRCFHLYGGRGITVCDEWNDFVAFLRDMGVRPKGTTIDRIDNNKGYYKENCRWATPVEQAKNRRKYGNNAA